MILEGLREAETGDGGVREHVARASMKTGMWREGRIASAYLEAPRERARARQVNDARVVTQFRKRSRSTVLVQIRRRSDEHRPRGRELSSHQLRVLCGRESDDNIDTF